jgi:hypothetical protein
MPRRFFVEIHGAPGADTGHYNGLAAERMGEPAMTKQDEFLRRG